MDQGQRKAGLVLATVPALIASRQPVLAVIVVVAYLICNTVLHLAGKRGVEEGEHS